MIKFHTLTGESYKNLRFDIIKKVEGVKPQAYYDSATPSNPTIGIGFNLKDSTVLRAVLGQFGINQTSTDDAPYVDRINKALGAAKTDDATLRSALDSIMTERSAILGKGRESFEFDDEEEMKVVFDELAGTYEGNINVIAHVPDAAGVTLEAAGRFRQG